MFTGIIEHLGTVEQMSGTRAGRQLVVHQADISTQAAIGDSIAVNGVCLTAVANSEGRLRFEVGPETLRLTNLGQLADGERVNLEQALRPTSKMSGHFVQGHVDGVGSVSERVEEDEWVWMRFELPEHLLEQLVPKGSIAVDGISLTITDIDRQTFRVMLIPHTLDNTTLGFRQPGEKVNIETDILGKYVLHMVRNLPTGLSARNQDRPGAVVDQDIE